MSSENRLKGVLSMDLLPVVLQAIVIATLLLLSYPNDLLFRFLAPVVSILWIKASKNPIPDKVMKARSIKKLYLSLVMKQNKETAEEDFDKLLAEELLLHAPVDSNEMKSSIISGQIANVARDLMVAGLYIYLIAILAIHYFL